MHFQDIFANNAAWIQDKLAQDSDYFTKLASGQEPKVFYIGCADSRVTAEAIMGAQPGDIFVHRNVANMVCNHDLGVMSSLEYAVAHLKVEHVVVCGHYNCGGVKAAMQSNDLGTLNPWLREIRDVYRIHQATLDAIEDEEARYKRLVELNVQEQCINILNSPVVQKTRATTQLPQVHGWVFDLGTGKLIDLNIDLDAVNQGIEAIYKVG